MTVEKASEFGRMGKMDDAELAESLLRYHAREANVWDESNDTVIVTRGLLLTGADAIWKLRCGKSEN